MFRKGQPAAVELRAGCFLDGTGLATAARSPEEQDRQSNFAARFFFTGLVVLLQLPNLST